MTAPASVGAVVRSRVDGDGVWWGGGRRWRRRARRRGERRPQV